jgi:hypothetical protein
MLDMMNINHCVMYHNLALLKECQVCETHYLKFFGTL